MKTQKAKPKAKKKASNKKQVLQPANATASNKAVLIRVSIPALKMRVKDKTMTEGAKASVGMKADLARTWKDIAKGKESLAVTNAGQKLRNLLKTKGAPWFDGMVIVPSSRVLEIVPELREGAREVENCVAAYAAALGDLIQKDKIALQGAFCISDYPRPEEVAAKAKVSIEVLSLPVPTADSLALFGDLDLERVKIAKANLLERVQEALFHCVERISKGDDAVLHGSILSNVVAACEESLAIVWDDDAQLKSAFESVKTQIAALKIDDIKSSDSARNEAQEKAREALSKIDSMMESFI